MHTFLVGLDLGGTPASFLSGGWRLGTVPARFPGDETGVGGPYQETVAIPTPRPCSCGEAPVDHLAIGKREQNRPSKAF